MAGVVVVTWKGSFMAKRDIFLKIGFIVVDSAPPDFKLLVYPFGVLPSVVKFNTGMEALLPVILMGYDNQIRPVPLFRKKCQGNNNLCRADIQAETRID